MSASRVEVHADADELATTVAGALLAHLADAQAVGEVPHVALTGGTIAEALHREVARMADESEVDWSRVVFWWGDERFVAADSPDRNAGSAREVFLDRVDVDPANVHEMPSTDSAADVEAGAAAYSEEMRRHGSGEFDLVMLGMGPDGHVASLFPGAPQLDAEGQVAVAVTGSPKPPPERISLTLETLNKARHVWFLVSGEGKAEAVARALAEPPPDLHEVPAAGVTGHGETTWFLDRAAASRL